MSGYKIYTLQGGKYEILPANCSYKALTIAHFWGRIHSCPPLTFPIRSKILLCILLALLLNALLHFFH